MLITWGLVHSLIFMIDGHAIAHDDAKLNVLVQSYQWGYYPGNPPLYEWLLRTVQLAVGPGLLSFLIVKYTLFTITGVTTYLALQELGLRRVSAPLVAISLIGFYQLGWNYHQAFTHSLVLIAAISIFLWAMARYLSKPTLGSCAILGVALGLGVLSKYNFPATVVIVAIAISLSPPARSSFRHPGLFLSLALAGLMILPHGLWLSDNIPGFQSQLNERIAGQDTSYSLRMLMALPQGIWAVLSFFLPIGLIALTFRPQSAIALRWLPAQWLAWTLPVGIGVFLLLVFLGGMASVQERYAIAFLQPALLALIYAFQEALEQSFVRTRFFTVMVVFALLIPAVRLTQWAFPGPPFCKNCSQWVPVYTLGSDGLVKDPAKSTLVGFDDLTAGNLRALYPQARVVSSHLNFYQPPRSEISAYCYFFWSIDLSPPPPQDVISAIDPATIKQITADWRHPLRKAPWRSTTWQVATLSPSHYAYHELCAIPHSARP